MIIARGISTGEISSKILHLAFTFSSHDVI